MLSLLVAAVLALPAPGGYTARHCDYCYGAKLCPNGGDTNKHWCCMCDGRGLLIRRSPTEAEIRWLCTDDE